MDRSNKMSETESEIMEVLWNSEEPMSAAQLLAHFAEHHGKSWKAQTLSTFLARLTQKELVTSFRRGRVIYYQPIQTRAEYRQSIARGILDTMYQGSVKTFFAALYGDEPLSARDREELRQWLDQEASK
ncbi:MAG: BlaI/MecI/CopY family transcriptional regulator [Oscillospiraceae bacterium]|nr:BlaI/MecI/CopY family transcriptional regulator [Oscillospiraceae bacterium]